MDEFRFFKEAALRICGSLQIEEALQSCRDYIAEFIPADRMNLHRFDRDFGTMQAIATATAEEARKLNVLIPVSSQARQTPRLKVKASDSDVRIFNHPEENALCREMMKFLNIHYNSIMVMRLHLKDQILGSFVLMSQEPHVYTPEHASLLELIREPLAIALANTLAHQDVIRLKNVLDDDNQFLHSELSKQSGEDIVGANFGLKEVMHQVRQVAGLDSPVLLLGETGTGKDVIARALHTLSPRNSNPFIPVNCGAIPENLIDSELFGHEKGAFTGALAQKRGRFERADGGTLFLDEIGELPMQSQVRLLRVLQNREIERVGGQESIRLDIRIVAATNRDLKAMIQRGTFREDLWFRLNVFPVTIPPLRERVSDIPSLVQHFIQIKAKELKISTLPRLADRAMDDLIAYAWPGNVRELQNVVERALILNPHGPLHFESLHAASQVTDQRVQPGMLLNEIATLDEITVRHIKFVLEKTGGKIHGPGGAAELLGLNASTLRNRMKKLGVK